MSKSLFSCYWYVKDTILKAIHNNKKQNKYFHFVVTDMSKIQFWKQFTTLYHPSELHPRCYWYVKDTILKAIHNHMALRVLKLKVVTDMSKIQFWKQFTTYAIFICFNFCCYWYVKDTILKAIHNSFFLNKNTRSVVTDMSKIQFWKQFTT